MPRASVHLPSATATSTSQHRTPTGTAELSSSCAFLHALNAVRAAFHCLRADAFLYASTASSIATKCFFSLSASKSPGVTASTPRTASIAGVYEPVRRWQRATLRSTDAAAAGRAVLSRVYAC